MERRGLISLFLSLSLVASQGLMAASNASEMGAVERTVPVMVPALVRASGDTDVRTSGRKEISKSLSRWGVLVVLVVASRGWRGLTREQKRMLVKLWWCWTQSGG